MVVVAGFASAGFVANAQPVQATALKESSILAYRLVHPLHEVDAVSHDAVFDVLVLPSARKLLSVAARVDVMTFDSGNSNRDSHAMEVIDAITFPEASFTSTSIVQSGDSINVAGRLTFHGVTNDLTMRGTVKWMDHRLEVRGAWDLSLTAFKVERPALLLMPVEDRLRFTFAVTLTWAQGSAAGPGTDNPHAVPLP